MSRNLTSYYRIILQKCSNRGKFREIFLKKKIPRKFLHHRYSQPTIVNVNDPILLVRDTQQSNCVEEEMTLDCRWELLMGESNA
jgi:hypothetical protein